MALIKIQYWKNLILIIWNNNNRHQKNLPNLRKNQELVSIIKYKRHHRFLKVLIIQLNWRSLRKNYSKQKTQFRKMRKQLETSKDRLKPLSPLMSKQHLKMGPRTSQPNQYWVTLTFVDKLRQSDFSLLMQELITNKQFTHRSNWAVTYHKCHISKICKEIQLVVQLIF